MVVGENAAKWPRKSDPPSDVIDPQADLTSRVRVTNSLTLRVSEVLPAITTILTQNAGADVINYWHLTRKHISGSLRLAADQVALSCLCLDSDDKVYPE